MSQLQTEEKGTEDIKHLADRRERPLTSANDAQEHRAETNDNEKGDAAITAAGSGTEPINPTKRRLKWKKEVLSFIDDQWFLIAMGLVIAIASQAQVPNNQQEVKSTVVSYLCVSVIFFSTGCTLDTKVLVQDYSRWRTHLLVQGQCFLMCSALMFGVVSLTAINQNFMDAGILIGLVFVSCVPTTIASNVVMTRQAHGSVELTVVQTTIGNFIGVFIAPALVAMYTMVPTWYNDVLPDGSGNFTEIYRRVFKQLGLSIYVPLIAGQIVRYFFADTCNIVFRKWKLNKLGSYCMIVIIWSTYDQAFASKAFDTVPPTNLVFLVFISLAMWIVYLSVSCFASLLWFSKRDIVAIAYCVTGKGPAVGVPLATAFFTGLSLELESKIQVPIVVYQALQIAGGRILIVIFRRWVDTAERR